MSTDVRIPTDQGPAAGRDGSPAPAGDRPSAQSLVQESIKYRRRAQEAERRAEALETEIQALREAQDGRASSLENELAQTRNEAETLRGRLEAVERDRRLERELFRAGCTDTETALALARERLSCGQPPEDLAGFARTLLEEKPHLRTVPDAPGTSPGPRGLPPRTAAAKPSSQPPVRRIADRLAEQARQSGSATDLMAYMRARRAPGA
jgi:galactokinase